MKEYGAQRKFGYLWVVVFLLLSAYGFFKGSEIWIFGMVTSTIVLAISLLAPFLLVLPNLLWLKVGHYLGLVVSPLILTTIFILVFIPFGLVVQMVSKLSSMNSLKSAESSYWVEREYPLQPFDSQF
tara:strand:- start:248 stop:628 length:381 start_codon:yes stop_codon:yes gene_type:complete